MQDELDLRHYVGIVRRHLLLVIVTTIVVGGAALGASLLEKPRYRATATILFTPQAQSFTGNSSEDPARVLSTLANLATNNAILSRAASKLGSNETALLSRKPSRSTLPRIKTSLGSALPTPKQSAQRVRPIPSRRLF